MQAKVFFASFLAAILAVGVIATPVDVEGASTTAVNTVFEKVSNLASLGAPDPRPSGPVITPKPGDVPTSSTSVVTRDLVNIKPSSINWVRPAVTDSHHRRAWKRENLGVLGRLLIGKRYFILYSPFPLNLIKLL